MPQEYVRNKHDFHKRGSVISSSFCVLLVQQCEYLLCRRSRPKVLQIPLYKFFYDLAENLCLVQKRSFCSDKSKLTKSQQKHYECVWLIILFLPKLHFVPECTVRFVFLLALDPSLNHKAALWSKHFFLGHMSEILTCKHSVLGCWDYGACLERNWKSCFLFHLGEFLHVKTDTLSDSRARSCLLTVRQLVQFSNRSITDLTPSWPLSRWKLTALLANEQGSKQTVHVLKWGWQWPDIESVYPYFTDFWLPGSGGFGKLQPGVTE